jgi:hypothetical protein
MFAKNRQKRRIFRVKMHIFGKKYVNTRTIFDGFLPFLALFHPFFYIANTI